MIRKAHGAGRDALVRCERLPADELPMPSARAPSATEAAAWADLTPDERVVRWRELLEAERKAIWTSLTEDEQNAMKKAWARVGGLVKAARTRLARSIGLVVLAHDHEFAAYERHGEDLAEQQLKDFANKFQCEVTDFSDGTASVLLTAGLQVAASRFFFDKGKLSGDNKMLAQSSVEGDKSGQNILKAYELAARDAAALTKKKREDEIPVGFEPDDGGAQ